MGIANKIYFLLFVAFVMIFTSCKSLEKSETKECCEKKVETALYSEITCPKCEYKKIEKLPTDVCLISYTCEKCKTVLNPKISDCCVFCTYGDHKCPSKQ